MDNELKNLDVINSDTIQSIRLNNYVMDNNKFQNLNQCRVEFGLFGGNNVSQTKSNIIDVENSLKGLTIVNSKCPENNYTPSDSNNYVSPNNIKNTPELNLEKVHLKHCNFFDYPGIPMENQHIFNKCD
tara:strand:+ start:21 stop:407 length:387 start_codon:yes stop_codon:yes gene_type:complete